jgi:hypothetical protein
MDKEVLEFIVRNGSSMPLSKLSKKAGYSLERVRLALERHNVRRYRTYTQEQVDKASESRSKSSEKRLEKMRVESQTPWPKVTTTMNKAMRGKSYGGNTSLPGTKNPIKASAVYSINVCTFKSSMGW